MSEKSPVKLYAVTVEREYVFASTSDDPRTVADEFDRALRTGEVDDDVEGDAATHAVPLSLIPAGYDLTSIPWGRCVEDDKTIAQYIDEGAAPKYVEEMARLQRVRAKVKAKP